MMRCALSPTALLIATMVSSRCISLLRTPALGVALHVFGALSQFFELGREPAAGLFLLRRTNRISSATQLLAGVNDDLPVLLGFLALLDVFADDLALDDPKRRAGEDIQVQAAWSAV